jgi:hypothetical protein
MAAYKDVLLSTYPVFEVTFNDRAYYLRLHRRDEEPEEASGPARDFPERHPELAELFWLRSTLFVPGDLQSVAGVGSGGGAESALLVRGTSGDGVPTVYRLERGTLAVRSARLSPPGERAPIEIRYDDYRLIAGVPIPHAVDVRREDGGFRMRGAILDLELNGRLDADAFTVPEAKARPR